MKWQEIYYNLKYDIKPETPEELMRATGGKTLKEARQIENKTYKRAKAEKQAGRTYKNWGRKTKGIQSVASNAVESNRRKH